MSDLKLVTFKTNQTILANCEFDVVKQQIKLKEPVQVVVQPTQNGPVMGFAPFLEYTEEFSTGIVVESSDVLCVTTPVTELRNQYNKMFGSGIQIVNSIPTSKF